MVYTDNQLKGKIIQMMGAPESEAAEFKEAKIDVSFNDIGRYFSALSNEANIRGLQEAWLIFGVSDDGKFVGTEFRKHGGLQNLKKELMNGTNDRLTFMEVYELAMEKCRVIAFQIPPAVRGVPTTWQGVAYARERGARERSAGERSIGARSAGEYSLRERGTGERSTRERGAGERSTGEAGTRESGAGERSGGERIARENSTRQSTAIALLPMNKVDLIRSQLGTDWSKEIVENATLEDLDEEAIKKVRELFSKRQGDRKKSQKILKKMSDLEVLNKAGITIKGRITRTALLLLGRSESSYFFDGFIPRITWTLYNANNSIKAYEHFDMPLLLAVDKVYMRIRNIKYRYIVGHKTLFPDKVDQYEPELVKEILNNCIVHQDYRLRGKINVEEFEDRLVFINEGAFIPETVEQALEPGYKPPYYRNMFLCNAMINLGMVDTNAMGIPIMYQIQRDKCFPLPTYDLNMTNRVKVIIYGKILDKNYTQLLYADRELDMRTVFLLDQVQKKEVISKESFRLLKKRGVVEGRYPNLFVSFCMSDILEQKAAYSRNKGMEDEICKQLILKTLESVEEVGKQQLMEVLESALPETLSDEQKSKKVSNMLQALKRKGLIATRGINRYAKWHKIE